MRPTWTILTPENVLLTFALASPVERASALLVDTLVVLFLNIPVALLIAALTTLGPLQDLLPGRLAEAELMGRAALLYVFTLIITLMVYYILSEGLWSGQTVGKRLFRLRVLTTDGTAPDLAAATIRNVLRLVDYFPGTCGVGFVVMLISPHFRRVGDYAAGTLVVREGFTPPPTVVPHLTLPVSQPRFLDALALANLNRLADKQILALRYFLIRGSNVPEGTQRLVASQLAEKVSALLWEGEQRPVDDPIAFLQEVVALYDQRRSGP
ncbi:MAG: RDD family protein [Armatimonadetes bacterium]|nr:RDD family protein [Armatimonadota bacterium]MDW8122479.1 RDD family protein [Armatimonadota bacterium]